MIRALLDTSVVIAIGRGELDADAIDAETRIAASAVTLAELHHGLLVARDEHRALRLATIGLVTRTCEILDVDARVAEAYGRIAADARRIRGRRIAMADGLIAATAAAHRLPLYTRDRDFAGLPGLDARVV